MEVMTRTIHRKRRRLWKKIVMAGVVSTFISFLALSLLVLYAYQMERPSLTVPETTVVYAANGETIGEFHQGEHRYWIPLDHMGDAIVEATLAIEDRRFYDHYGFDPIRISRAILTNLKSGAKVQGASTITQQYARNLFLTHDKTWTRKWNEALYALRLELHYSKKDILEGYLNTIYYGHGAYGIEAASTLYFDKNAEDLTYGEAALLAGIPKGPSMYSPLLHEDKATERQATVLYSMREAGFISGNDQVRYEAEPLEFSSSQDMAGKRMAPFFQDAVRSWLINEYGLDPNVIDGGGLDIYTTLSPETQHLAEKTIANELNPEKELEVALVAMDPRTGEVKALIGGKNYQENSYNRATQAKREPGSTMKPFLYYAALEHGLRANSMLKSEETTFVYDGGRKEYAPRNFNHRYADDYITMLQALAISDNIFAMKTHFLLGFEDLQQTAAQFGINSPLKAVPSLALGTSAVSVLEITSSYSPFANGGYQVKPRLIDKVVDRDGNILVEEKMERTQQLNPAYTAIMTDMMKGMFEPELSANYGAVTGGSISDALDRPVAGKSGSTLSDSWMIGYTPQLVTGVWAGYDDARELESRDASYSKQIWAQFMNKSLAGELKLPFPVPKNVTEVEINPFNGLLATEECPVSRPTLFYNGTEPTEYCTEHLDHLEDQENDADEQLDEEFRKKEEAKKQKWLNKFFHWFD
ncbi:monofunctional biosynthetic peptidoglycan transglycosylase [Salipaludibacillus keqinensis]|uniref:Monofunctional biosynthetic peptidoglycan transglycosylase n=1 Tax=Salipaludibacillus keqinensis TaxID=2045207 RepID=A0A323TGB6_9BACI|nr:PBP1A family penicillin-binding protein [Salipaludibacillus keqinensis]PYZ91593.1 monofunctional biosynthetic peptidoglycan transglycosylase [Salipaludibacillus keqinensis]